MKTEAGVEPRISSMPNDVLHGLPSALVLVAGRNRIVLGVRTIFAIRQQNRYLRTQF